MPHLPYLVTFNLNSRVRLEKAEDLAAELGGIKKAKASISRRDRSRRIDRLDDGSNSYQTME